MNLNIWGDFQICISVPLIDTPNGIIRRNRRHINLTKEDISVRHNNDNELVELNNNSDNQITNGRNITSNENVEQIAEPSNTAIKPSSVVEHDDSEPSTTLRRSNRIKIDLTIWRIIFKRKHL